MKPTPQKGAGAVGAPTRDAESPANEQAANPLRALEYPRQSSEAALAMLAFGANQALVSQVSLAYILGQLAQDQSKGLARASESTLPEGITRDAILAAARMQAGVADSIIEIANRWGRAFGRLAFAFPLPARSA